MSKKIVLSAALALSILGLSSTFAAPAKPEVKTVTLTERDGRDYDKCSYSFRFATSDPAIHKNYADLVYNNCGSLHLNPFNGSKSRATDLGAFPLDKAPDDAANGATWTDGHLDPVVGNVYLMEVNVEGDAMTVKFRVNAIKDKDLTFSYLVVKGGPFNPPAKNRGAAGTMGKCGGPHKKN